MFNANIDELNSVIKDLDDDGEVYSLTLQKASIKEQVWVMSLSKVRVKITLNRDGTWAATVVMDAA